MFSWCLSSSILKLFKEGESTIYWGNEFQSLITLLLKKFDLVSEFTWYLNNFIMLCDPL